MKYNKETKTVIISYQFNEEIENIPIETENIIINTFYFKIPLNLPPNITNIIFSSESFVNE